MSTLALLSGIAVLLLATGTAHAQHGCYYEYCSFAGPCRQVCKVEEKKVELPDAFVDSWNPENLGSGSEFMVRCGPEGPCNDWKIDIEKNSYVTPRGECIFDRIERAGRNRYLTHAICEDGEEKSTENVEFELIDDKLKITWLPEG
jgi:hypothetical protein